MDKNKIDAYNNWLKNNDMGTALGFNEEERMAFIDSWAELCRNDFGSAKKIQNLWINNRLKKGRELGLTVKEYLGIKGEPCSR